MSFTYCTKIASYLSPWFRHYVLQYIFHKVAKVILLKLKAKQKLFTWRKCSLGENANLEERLTSLQSPQIPTWSIYHCFFEFSHHSTLITWATLLFLKHSGQTIAKGCTLFLFSGFQHPSLSICFINPSIPSSLYLNITFKVGLSYPSYLYFNPPSSPLFSSITITINSPSIHFISLFSFQLHQNKINALWGNKFFSFVYHCSLNTSKKDWHKEGSQ